MAHHKSLQIHNSLEACEKDKTRCRGSLKTAFPQVFLSSQLSWFEMMMRTDEFWFFSLSFGFPDFFTLKGYSNRYLKYVCMKRIPLNVNFSVNIILLRFRISILATLLICDWFQLLWSNITALCRKESPFGVFDISATLWLSFYVSFNPFMLQEDKNDTNPLTSACSKFALPLVIHCLAQQQKILEKVCQQIAQLTVGCQLLF